MKTSFFIIVCALTLMVGCTNKGQTAGGADSDSLAVDSLVAEVRDTTPRPMFLYYFDPDHMQVVYWTDPKESDSLFDAYRRNVAP